MKFIMARELQHRPAQVWKQLKKEKELIVTSNGAPVALMIPLDSDTVDEELEALHRAKAFQALDALGKEAMNKGLDRLSDAEIDTEIKAVRRERHR